MDTHLGNQSRRRRGFTLLELTIVIVIIGALVSVAVTSWYSLLESRKIAKTASTLQQIRSCLVKRIHFSERYPSYPASGVPDCATDDSDVSRCLCESGLADAWGGDVYLLAGIDGTGAGLNNVFLLDRVHQGREGVAVSPGPDSRVRTHDGTTLNNVAFVLVSFGKDGRADNASYRTLFHPQDPNVRVAPITAGTMPDFESSDTGTDDDVYLAITADELLGLIMQ